MKFKKGDRLKIIGNSNSHDFELGDIVTIIKLDGGKYICELIAGGDYWWCVESDVEFSKPIPDKEQLKLKKMNLEKLLKKTEEMIKEIDAYLKENPHV